MCHNSPPHGSAMVHACLQEVASSASNGPSTADQHENDISMWLTDLGLPAAATAPPQLQHDVEQASSDASTPPALPALDQSSGESRMLLARAPGVPGEVPVPV